MKKNEVMKTNSTEDILLRQKNDRRMLSYVPDKQNIRNHVGRRGSKKVQSLEDKADSYIKSIQSGIRYEVEYCVKVVAKGRNGRKKFTCKGLDISSTGILLQVEDEAKQKILREADRIYLDFKIIPGTIAAGWVIAVPSIIFTIHTKKTITRIGIRQVVTMSTASPSMNLFSIYLNCSVAILAVSFACSIVSFALSTSPAKKPSSPEF